MLKISVWVLIAMLTHEIIQAINVIASMLQNEE